MQAVINQFRINIDRTRQLNTIHNTLRAQTTRVIDLSDILRAELVMAVSAIDHYVHEIVRAGMLESYQGNRARTPAFLRFSVSLNGVLQGLPAPTDVNWLAEEIRTQHVLLSFEKADKIADAIRLIWGEPLWPAVAAQLGISNPADVRDRLDLIVDRRNKIAHEADINPTIGPDLPGNRWPIDENLVNETIDFIEQVAEAIHGIVT
jgi:hypothetical protein